MHEDLRARASELRVAVLRLEQSIYEANHYAAQSDAQKVLSLARTVSAYLRAGSGDDTGWLYSHAGRLTRLADRVDADSLPGGV